MSHEAEDANDRRIYEALVARLHKAANAGVGVRLSAEEVWVMAGSGFMAEDASISHG